MSLMNCPECNNEVSSKAPACPKCGAPIAGAEEAKAAGVALTTTQLTSKKLKSHMVIATLMCLFGFMWMMVGFSGEYPEPSGWSILVMVVGLVWLVITKLRTWWHHG